MLCWVARSLLRFVALTNGPCGRLVGPTAGIFKRPAFQTGFYFHCIFSFLVHRYARYFRDEMSESCSCPLTRLHANNKLITYA